MLKTVFAKFALFALLALFFAHVDAARVGDSGKGWRVVKADNYDGVTCVYSGDFRIRATCGKYISYSRRKCKSNVELDQSSAKESTWTVKPTKGGGYKLSAKNVKGCTISKTLALRPGMDMSNMDYERNDVELVLGSTRNKFVVRPGPMGDGTRDPSDTYCTKNVLIEPLGMNTYLYHNASCSGFIFDGDSGEWDLEAV